MITELDSVTKATWLRFVDEIEPHRQDLFRYCLKLTGNPFDAEDLVHDGMMRAFSSMASHMEPLSSPRGFLLKTTSNLWIDAVRRSRLGMLDQAERVEETDTDDLREAVSMLISSVNPREQVIIVLHEVFEMTHKEIAGVLSTTEGAVKVALHRSRRKLKNAELPARAPKQLVENFITVFQTHDIAAIKALLAPEFEANVFPYTPAENGPDYHAEKGWLYGCLFHHIAEREDGAEPYPLHIEVREVAGEFVALVHRNHGAGNKLEEIWRFEADEGELIRVKDYGFCPDMVSWIADQLELPFNKVGYRLHEDSYQ